MLTSLRDAAVEAKLAFQVGVMRGLVTLCLTCARSVPAGIEQESHERLIEASTGLLVGVRQLSEIIGGLA